MGLPAPHHLRGPGGAAKSGVTGTNAKRLLIDQVIPTTCDIWNQRSDRLRANRLIVVFDVACAWELLVGGREFQKRKKYQELAAVLSHQRSSRHPSGAGGPGAGGGPQRLLAPSWLQKILTCSARRRRGRCSLVNGRVLPPFLCFCSSTTWFLVENIKHSLINYSTSIQGMIIGDNPTPPSHAV